MSRAALPLCVCLVFLAGCKARLNMDKTVKLTEGPQAFIVDAISSEQKIKVSVEAADAPVHLFVYLEKNKEAAEGGLFDTKKETAFLGRKLQEKSIEMEVTVPANEAVVVAVHYRLAPEHKFPGAVDDTHAAWTWIRDHASEFSIDPERVAVGGDSAGGCLAIVTTLLARDAGGRLPSFALLVYPVTDLEYESTSMREARPAGSTTTMIVSGSVRTVWVSK